jgi:hypothetical protein
MQIELAAKFPTSRLYLPFQFRSDGLRLMSNYFAKLPVRMAEFIFGDESIPPIADRVAARTQSLVRRQFLQPFEPRADSKYIALSHESAPILDRSHQALVTAFSAWLAYQGKIPGTNQAIDIGLTTPPVVIEAKAIRGTWAQSIRQAIGQLYEYRYFQVVSSAANLLFLASERVPDQWLRYLEQDRKIGVAWMEDDGDFFVTDLAKEFLGLGALEK